MTDKLEKCVCGTDREPSALYNDSGFYWVECMGDDCSAMTPDFTSGTDAASAWNRMQSAETFTRAEVIDLIKLVPWRSGYESEDILAEFLAARRKP